MNIGDTVPHTCSPTDKNQLKHAFDQLLILWERIFWAPETGVSGKNTRFTQSKIPLDNAPRSFTRACWGKFPFLQGRYWVMTITRYLPKTDIHDLSPQL